uniref:Uncharacterized protein n=1 Tax=Siphoviridae sp. ctgN495 TaxID=2825608 RepID=A0A8S5UCY6_9CAUD|nr:MAG TPA: hypothetical protein [Siphoviridae sp. ctgN495]
MKLLNKEYRRFLLRASKLSTMTTCMKCRIEQ